MRFPAAVGAVYGLAQSRIYTLSAVIDRASSSIESHSQASFSRQAEGFSNQ